MLKVTLTEDEFVKRVMNALPEEMQSFCLAQYMRDGYLKVVNRFREEQAEVE